MKSKRFVGLSLVLVFLIIFNAGGAVLANTSNLSTNPTIQLISVDIPFTAPDALDDIDSISTKEALVINGVQNELYCTFDNRDQAIEDLEDKIPTLLTTLKNNYNLSDLSDLNWEQYREKFMIYCDQLVANNLMTDSIQDEITVLRCFFDIYEGYQRNEEIKNLVNLQTSEYSLNNSNSHSVLDDLAIKLPYFTPLAEEFNDDAVSAPMTRATKINISAAVSYAETYYYNPNSAYRYFVGADCTNFVSQIYDAGGIPMNYTGNLTSGWWYYVNNCSNSWSVADTFCRYFGIIYSTTSLYNISQDIQRGEVIAADFTQNGTYDHVGFITQKDASPSTWTGQYYYDFKVAQHTTNYHAWASGATNGWDDIQAEGGKYARINNAI